MKKQLIVLTLVLLLLLGITSMVTAQNCCPGAPVDNPCYKELGTYCVTYHENNCLRAVPIDQKGYQYGDKVKVLFEPVIYRDGLIFYGWSHTRNGYANYGYNYDSFLMPAENVDLYAICILPYYEEPEAPTETENGEL